MSRNDDELFDGSTNERKEPTNMVFQFNLKSICYFLNEIKSIKLFWILWSKRWGDTRTKPN